MTDLRGLNPNNGSGKLHGLDHLRTLAIITVFLFHYLLFEHPGWIETLGSFGWTEVDLFIVVSGYLIACQLFKNILQGKPFPVFSFYNKRFFRIFPAFLVVLCLYFMVPAFGEKEPPTLVEISNLYPKPWLGSATSGHIFACLVTLY